jgi:type VI secretion system secreted protein VgrG
MSSDPATLAAMYEIQAGDYAPADLNVLSFEGREEMNGLYSFDVLLWGKDLDEGNFESAVLGRPAVLSMHIGADANRHVRGIVSSVVFEGRREGGRRAFRVTIVPRLWLLQKRVNSRIFQDLTAQQIVDTLLEEHGIARAWNLLVKYPIRQYCVQYQESDLHFVTRILAEEGIFFCFEQPDGDPGDDVTESLVFGDNVHSYPAIAGDTGLIFRQQQGEGSMHAAEPHVLDFRARSRVESSAVAMRDYDFRRPRLDLRSSAASADAPIPLEVYDHHGEYEETDADANNAGVYLEQLRAGAREVHGLSMCRRLMPGHTFDLTEHELDTLNASYVVTHVEHKGVTPEAAKGSLRVYENHFRCVPAEVPFRPARPARVIRQVSESAVVVGPEGQEIFTDPFGRVKVQFHWDREGNRDEQSSCWMRVMQPWAGTGWGFQFIPRIGIGIIVTPASTQSTRRRSSAHRSSGHPASRRRPRGSSGGGYAQRSRCRRRRPRATSPRRSRPTATATLRRAFSPSASSSWHAATSASPQLSPKARAGPPKRDAASAARTHPTRQASLKPGALRISSSDSTCASHTAA